MARNDVSHLTHQFIGIRTIRPRTHHQFPDLWFAVDPEPTGNGSDHQQNREYRAGDKALAQQFRTGIGPPLRRFAR